ncbi:MAG: energy-coupled thiamine transporter ThiT [Oscillospiraceae bacterium]|nr:energy-coupled thiamine transporter ThiT [Oscillospiraceae bacterium]
MKTKRLTESAMLIALAVVLELVGKSIIPPMPFGGQLTIVSMLPIVLLSYRHGVRWGLVSGFGYALVQMALGAGTVTAAFQPGYFGDGVMLLNALTMCLLDYLAAYSVLGLGGIFRGRCKSRSTELLGGTVLALSARYLIHILSGYILFSGWAEWFFTQEGFPSWGSMLVSSLSPQMLGLTYSAVYNGMYMIPEIILTAIAALLVGRMPLIAAKVS